MNYLFIFNSKIIREIDLKLIISRELKLITSFCEIELSPLRNLKQARESRTPIYACFIGLKAIYGIVPKGRLWQVYEEYGVPAKICGLLRALYATTKSAVRMVS